MKLDTAELRRGLAETRRYLLSHHRPHEWDRCHQPTMFGRQVRICARCSGIYPGLILGLLAGFWGLLPTAYLLILAIFPAPALVDWSLTTFTERRGSNFLRTATGGLLGVAYGLGLVLLSMGRLLPVLVPGVLYSLMALGLLIAAAKTDRILGFK